MKNKTGKKIFKFIVLAIFLFSYRALWAGIIEINSSNGFFAQKAAEPASSLTGHINDFCNQLPPLVMVAKTAKENPKCQKIDTDIPSLCRKIASSYISDNSEEMVRQTNRYLQTLACLNRDSVERLDRQAAAATEYLITNLNSPPFTQERVSIALHATAAIPLGVMDTRGSLYSDLPKVLERHRNNAQKVYSQGPRWLISRDSKQDKAKLYHFDPSVPGGKGGPVDFIMCLTDPTCLGVGCENSRMIETGLCDQGVQCGPSGNKLIGMDIMEEGNANQDRNPADLTSTYTSPRGVSGQDIVNSVCSKWNNSGGLQGAGVAPLMSCMEDPPIGKKWGDYLPGFGFDILEYKGTSCENQFNVRSTHSMQTGDKKAGPIGDKPFVPRGIRDPHCLAERPNGKNDGKDKPIKLAPLGDFGNPTRDEDFKSLLNELMAKGEEEMTSSLGGTYRTLSALFDANLEDPGFSEDLKDTLDQYAADKGSSDQLSKDEFKSKFEEALSDAQDAIKEGAKNGKEPNLRDVYREVAINLCGHLCKDNQGKLDEAKVQELTKKLQEAGEKQKEEEKKKQEEEKKKKEEEEKKQADTSLTDPDFGGGMGCEDYTAEAAKARNQWFCEHHFGARPSCPEGEHCPSPEDFWTVGETTSNGLVEKGSYQDGPQGTDTVNCENITAVAIQEALAKYGLECSKRAQFNTEFESGVDHQLEPCMPHPDALRDTRPCEPCSDGTPGRRDPSTGICSCSFSPYQEDLANQTLTENIGKQPITNSPTQIFQMPSTDSSPTGIWKSLKSGTAIR